MQLGPRAEPTGSAKHPGLKARKTPEEHSGADSAVDVCAGLEKSDANVIGPPPNASRVLRKQWTRTEIAAANEAGRCVIIIDGRVYDLTQWAERHPGGELVLKHMRGRDATDEVLAFHPRAVLARQVPRFCIGVLADAPAANPISLAYRALERKLRAEGFFSRRFDAYGYEFAKLAVLLAAALTLTLHCGGGLGATTAGAFLLGAMWHQASFLGHDFGHNAVFHSFKPDGTVGTLVAVWLGGLSLGWWKRSHDVHHVVTNHPEHDPDIQHIPFFAVTPRFFESLYSTYHGRVMEFGRAAQRLVARQHYLFYVILTFGRFNLYVQSLLFLAAAKRYPFRYFEMAGYVFFAAWYALLVSHVPTWPGRLLFVFVSHATTMLLHVQITISHFAMDTRTSDQDPALAEETFAERALRTTMDIDCPAWMDGLHGGLQYQAIHHLFPRLPRHSLRRLVPRIQAFASAHGLIYHHYGFFEGNAVVLRAMRDVALQVHPFVQRRLFAQ